MHAASDAGGRRADVGKELGGRLPADAGCKRCNLAPEVFPGVDAIESHALLLAVTRTHRRSGSLASRSHLPAAGECARIRRVPKQLMSYRTQHVDSRGNLSAEVFPRAAIVSKLFAVGAPPPGRSSHTPFARAPSPSTAPHPRSHA